MAESILTQARTRSLAGLAALGALAGVFALTLPAGPAAQATPQAAQATQQVQPAGQTRQTRSQVQATSPTLGRRGQGRQARSQTQPTSGTARGAARRGGTRAPAVGTPYVRNYEMTRTPAHELVAKLDFERYKSNIKHLSDLGTRYWNTKGNEQARDWILAELKSYGYQPELQKFTASGTRTRPEPEKEIENIYVTKVGTTRPNEMYIVSSHYDSYNTQSPDESVAPGADDNGSGTSIVMELARVFASPDVKTDVTIRFAIWNAEEIGLNGARAYIAQRRELQGKEDPPGSGKYPEPKWLGMIEHDMMLFDHGMPFGTSNTLSLQQVRDADINVEYNSAQTANGGAITLAAKLLEANGRYATEYPAAVGPFMSNADSEAFAPLVPSISLRENERLSQIGRGANPNWHKSSDRYETYSDADFRLGFNAAQSTCGAIAEMCGLKAMGK